MEKNKVKSLQNNKCLTLPQSFDGYAGARPRNKGGQGRIRKGSCFPNGGKKTPPLKDPSKGQERPLEKRGQKKKPWRTRKRLQGGERRSWRRTKRAFSKKGSIRERNLGEQEKPREEKVVQQGTPKKSRRGPRRGSKEKERYPDEQSKKETWK